MKILYGAGHNSYSNRARERNAEKTESRPRIGSVYVLPSEEGTMHQLIYLAALLLIETVEVRRCETSLWQLRSQRH